MSRIKPSVPGGTRDFSPEQVAKRNHIFNVIRTVFERYGFQPIETPAMENLSTLTGKYGEEGDQLIFKILNSGDFLKDIPAAQLNAAQYKPLTPLIAEKALRYDLTVPFARYVVMHQHELAFPFKRYQIQPVWRADRPQKGRYREFWQCDADVIGSDSLLNEVELIQIYDEVFTKLGFGDFTIRINNRKILSDIAERLEVKDKFLAMTNALDKIDKTGLQSAGEEMEKQGIAVAAVGQLIRFLKNVGNNHENLKTLIDFPGMPTAGICEMQTLLNYFNDSVLTGKLVFDIALARGLNYYTGTIIEVKLNNISIGSVGGGGRYDDLTGMFGLPNMSGVGISFGADRIYDAMEELKLFPAGIGTFTKVLFTNFDAAAEQFALPLLQRVRQAGINAEIYPASDKLKKQMKYANDKKIPFVVLIGSEEMQSGQLALKHMDTGEQVKLPIDEVIAKLIKG